MKNNVGYTEVAPEIKLVKTMGVVLERKDSLRKVNNERFSTTFSSRNTRSVHCYEYRIHGCNHRYNTWGTMADMRYIIASSPSFDTQWFHDFKNEQK